MVKDFFRFLAEDATVDRLNLSTNKMEAINKNGTEGRGFLGNSIVVNKLKKVYVGKSDGIIQSINAFPSGIYGKNADSTLGLYAGDFT